MSALAVQCSTDVLRLKGQLVVCCEIEHFIPSGLTVPELFAQLRPQLVAAIEDAAARDHHPGIKPRAPRVQMDVGVPDPGISLWVHSPTAAIADMAGCIARMEAIVTRFTASTATL